MKARSVSGTGVRMAGAAVLCALAVTAGAQAPRSPTPATVDGPLSVVEVARGLDHPWGLAFLPDGRMLVTERAGQLLLIERDGKARRPVSGVPRVRTGGQGGLLGIALSPTFAKDRLVYLSFSEAGVGGAGTAVARGTLNDAALANVEVIWRQSPRASGPNHWGSRLVFARDGTLFVTTGDRYSERERAQDVSTTLGKVIRINPDGSIPKDNPFVGRANAKPEIWSYGHRNLQGAALHPATGQLWTLEHGARGGDELNHPEAGKNYGWPVITYGVDYSGVRIGEGTAKAGHGTAGLLLGSGHCAVGRDVLHGRRVCRVEGPAFRRLAAAGRAGAPAARRRQGGRRGALFAERRAGARRRAGPGRVPVPAHRRGRREAAAGHAEVTPLTRPPAPSPRKRGEGWGEGSDFHFEQRERQRLAVRVERERGRDAAVQRVLAHELQRGQLRQLVAADVALHDAAQMLRTASTVTRSASSA